MLAESPVAVSRLAPSSRPARIRSPRPRRAILAQAGEGVAIDDVVIRIPDEMPQFPIQCQQGCQCHHANIQRLSCCGATG